MIYGDGLIRGDGGLTLVCRLCDWDDMMVSTTLLQIGALALT